MGLVDILSGYASGPDRGEVDRDPTGGFAAGIDHVANTTWQHILKPLLLTAAAATPEGRQRLYQGADADSRARANEAQQFQQLLLAAGEQSPGLTQDPGYRQQLESVYPGRGDQMAGVLAMMGKSPARRLEDAGTKALFGDNPDALSPDDILARVKERPEAVALASPRSASALAALQPKAGASSEFQRLLADKSKLEGAGLQNSDAYRMTVGRLNKMATNAPGMSIKLISGEERGKLTEQDTVLDTLDQFEEATKDVNPGPVLGGVQSWLDAKGNPMGAVPPNVSKALALENALVNALTVAQFGARASDAEREAVRKTIPLVAQDPKTRAERFATLRRGVSYARSQALKNQEASGLKTPYRDHPSVRQDPKTGEVELTPDDFVNEWRKAHP